MWGMALSHFRTASIGRTHAGLDRGFPEARIPIMLGILMLQTRFARLPGDIGHPGSFAFPVRRVVVDGARPEAVVRGGDPRLLEPFVAAGRQLVADGAVAITTSCGFLARWQRELQAALPVPVWSSSLLKLAELRDRRCGVITIEAASLTAAHFEAVGADPTTPVEGITPGSPLHRTLIEDLPTLDAVDAEAQVLAAGDRLLARHPDVQVLVLECTNLPPYARALERASGRPVHDVVTLLNERMAALARSLAPARGHA
jgi:Asp/Glu/hydantoin racemase